ncbi:MAG: DUF4157 domain-containing protein, partial [Myxococcales bacterium]|nr:DUF4157 domain-containing protein [Myxococcales bacterium]
IQRLPDVSNFGWGQCTVDAPDAPAEREADRAAETSAPIAMREAASGGEPSPGLRSILDSHAGRGASLPDTVRETLEPRFDADLSDVRVHAGGEAHRLATGLGAKAFTYGSDIYFREGAYDPASHEGRKTLTHEVAHTVQQAEHPAVQRAVSTLEMRDREDSSGRGAPTPASTVEPSTGASMEHATASAELYTGDKGARVAGAYGASTVTIGPRIYSAAMPSFPVLAHELIHVRQWAEGRTGTAPDTPIAPSMSLPRSDVDDPLEREAHEGTVGTAQSEAVVFSWDNPDDALERPGPRELAAALGHRELWGFDIRILELRDARRAVEILRANAEARLTQRLRVQYGSRFLPTSTTALHQRGCGAPRSPTSSRL